MIQSFKDAWAKELYESGSRKHWASIRATAQRKLDQIDTASSLDDLRTPPGNRLEAMKGDRSGQHSIRINDQYRICFVWKDDGAHDVEIADYH
jgi:proteic killer suppression protein